MGTKNNPAAYDCYANALPDEPMFVLLARDPTASMLVRAWATQREYDIRSGVRPHSDMAMVHEANECAAAMTVWRAANDGKWRRAEARRSSPYGEMCRDPDVCAGKGYCPRDPTCGD